MIDRLVAGRRQSAGVSVGPGDDAAVVATPDGRVVVTTDMLVEGRHFRLDWSAPQDVGRKAIAQNAADVEAMGASSTAFVVAFGAPQDTPVERVQQLADGMWLEAGQFGAGIVGGDLVASPQWVISVTALGDLGGRNPVLRSGARPGSAVAVAGELGRSATGYTLWHNGIRDFEEVRRRHLVPRPPYGQGLVAAQAGAQAMTDVSDGLLADLDVVAAWERERSAPIAPRAQPSPLARMQSLAACGAASGPSSTRQVAQLESMILSPSSRFGRAARDAFVGALLRYCEATSRPDREPVDPAMAARLAHRFARLSHTDYGPALIALRRSATPRTTWYGACGIVADACAPTETRAAWSQRSTGHAGRPGRPRIDPTRPPPDVARLAWGAAHLAAAIDAWEVANA